MRIIRNRSENKMHIYVLYGVSNRDEKGGEVSVGTSPIDETGACYHGYWKTAEIAMKSYFSYSLYQVQHSADPIITVKISLLKSKIEQEK